MEASPSPVYGARLLSGFGAKTPSRVQIPPPPQCDRPPSQRRGPILHVRRAPYCKILHCTDLHLNTDDGAQMVSQTGLVIHRDRDIEVRSMTPVRRIAAAALVAVLGFGFVAAASVPANAAIDTTWGERIKAPR